MDEPRIYEIRVAGELPASWSAWLGGLAIHHEPNGETALIAPVADQAMLFGLLNRIQALNLTLVAVNPAPCPQPD